MIAQDARQAVEGDAARQVMHVVHADVGRKPAQEGRQIVMRAAMQCGVLGIPFAVARPDRVLELVLHVEQPDADRCGHQQRGQVHQQESLDADQPDQPAGHQRDGEVGRHCADPRAPAVAAHQPDRQAMLQQEEIGRSQSEHDQRMAVEPVAQAPPHRARAIFLDRQRVDVAHAAAVEIAAAGVMGGVGTAPHVVGRHRDDAGEAADPVVGEAMAEERAVAAVVLDHEQPQQEGAGSEGKRQRQPVADVESEPGQQP